jgi:tripartite-type tricarboxylate transporter receptor subunit TctC
MTSLRIILRAIVLAVVGLAATLSATDCVLAQEWPDRPVRIIVPFPPGSSPDIVARLIGDQLTKNLQKPFVVENKPGAGGMIGTDAIAKALPDGTTIGVSITGPLVNNTLLYKKMAYDPFTDLAPITQAISQPCVLAANKEFGASNIKEMIAELKSKPGRYNYGSLGNGTNAHLIMEVIASKTSTKMVQVPYPGVGQAVQALLTNDVQLGCLPPIGVIPQARAGKLKVIGVAAKNRSPLLAEYPTLAEQGLSGVEANSWIGVVAPARTPQTILARIRTEIVRVLKDPEVAKTLHTQFMEPVGNTPEEFAAYMKDELDRWGPIIKQNNITVD